MVAKINDTYPSVISGCMRFADFDRDGMNRYIHSAMELGINFFDHADIYGGGRSEEIFGEAMKGDGSLKREDMILQSKCGIRPGICYDLSKDYILQSVDNILKRLNTEYLDILLLHRPDALVDPEEVAEAFDKLEQSGKVRKFGVSNHKPMQIELLKKYVKQPQVNMTSGGSIDRDGSVLDYCRLNGMTIQAWSPYQMPDWKGCFLGSDEYWQLNQDIHALAENYQVSDMAIATAWILRHPAKMQVIAGTINLDRLKHIVDGSHIELTREEWYKLYMAAGHPLP